MRANAAASLRDEPRCKQFDVCVDPEGSGRVFLYELYVERSAFDAHLRSEHFGAFDRAVMAWVESEDC